LFPIVNMLQTVVVDGSSSSSSSSTIFFMERTSHKCIYKLESSTSGSCW